MPEIDDKINSKRYIYANILFVLMYLCKEICLICKWIVQVWQRLYYKQDMGCVSLSNKQNGHWWWTLMTFHSELIKSHGIEHITSLSLTSPSDCLHLLHFKFNHFSFLCSHVHGSMKHYHKERGPYDPENSRSSSSQWEEREWAKTDRSILLSQT